MLTVLATMLASLTLVFSIVYYGVKAETRGRYQTIMKLVSEKLENILSHEEVCARNVFAEIPNRLESPETVLRALENEMRLNSYIDGYFVAFEPGYFPQYEYWFEAYLHRNDLHARNIGSSKHDYFQRDWYKRGKNEEDGYWTDPYFDDWSEKDIVCTFAMPLYDRMGRKVGVCGADMSLKWLVKELNTINEKSYNTGLVNIHLSSDFIFHTFIITNKGTYVAHPDEKRVMQENVMSYIDQNDEEAVNAVNEMMAQKHGIASMTIDGNYSTVYYMPIKSTDWEIAIAVPKKTFWLPAIFVLTLLIVVTLVGLWLVYKFSRSTIHQAVKPLSALSKSANEVSKGNFDTPLPELTYRDEIGDLRDSFASMQTSLARYVIDMKQKAAQEAALNNELEVARNIQMSMVPREFPPYPQRDDIDIYGYLEPAKSIGGDLYDFFIRDEKLFFCIGDVSGKGIPAALVQSATHFMFRIMSQREDDPSRIVSNINDVFAAENDSSMFCTFFLGVLDLKTHVLEYCNAGHELPILVTTEATEIRVKPNIAMGLYMERQYRKEQIELPSGSVLILYTDGLKEAIDSTEECYGRERILTSLQRVIIKGATEPSDYIRQLVNDVTLYVGDMPQADDLTMLAIKVY
jgi:sigma-B regulation protein RsbU (phosphoserine phosphatase)